MGTPGTATQLPPLDVGKALYDLFNEVIIGTAYLSMAKSVAVASKSHPCVSPKPHPRRKWCDFSGASDWVLENDFVVVTGTGTARDFIRLLNFELH